MRRIVAALMALLIFLITSGIVVTVHECRREGKKELVVFQEKDCCAGNQSSCQEPKDSQDSFNKCCNVTTAWLVAHVETIVLVNKIDLQPKAFSSTFFETYCPFITNPDALFLVQKSADPPDSDSSTRYPALADLRVFRI